MGLMWTVTARGEKDGFINRGGRLAVRHRRAVYTFIDCAAKRLEYFIQQLKRSRSRMLSFHFLFSRVPEGSVFSCSLDFALLGVVFLFICSLCPFAGALEVSDPALADGTLG